MKRYRRIDLTEGMVESLAADLGEVVEVLGSTVRIRRYDNFLELNFLELNFAFSYALEEVPDDEV